MRMRPVVVLVLAAGLLGTAACSADPPADQAAAAGRIGASTSPAASASGAAGGQASSPAGPVQIPQILAFTAETLDGKRFNAATLAGHPTLLWFWAPWCATCAGQADSIATINEKYKGKLGVLGVAGLGDKAAMDDFVRELGVGAVTHVNDKTGGIWKRFAITEQSTFVMLDASGKVIQKGWLDDVALNQKIDALAA